MTTAGVFGLQWGDEAKGKLVAHLAPQYDLVVRFNGGGNAGHTIFVGNRKVVLKHIPSGIVCPGVQCLMMPGMVLEPATLFEEIAALKALNIDVTGRLRISGRIHLTLDWHRSLDLLGEDVSGGAKIGTTGRGIGPTYSDKVSRIGIRVADLFDPEGLRALLDRSLCLKAPILAHYKIDLPNLDAMYARLLAHAELLAPFVCDTPMELCEALMGGRRVLFEGANAAMLDIDLGSYPYVTSSHTTAAGVGSGCGVAVGDIAHSIGVSKAYCTRVGGGPFPTELHDDRGRWLQEKGVEFGSTTGRPRRCGWLDAFAVRACARLGGIRRLCLTKLDVMAGMSEIKFGVGYRNWKGAGLPESRREFAALEPVYETLPGFEGDISGCRRFDALPPAAQAYVRRVEAFIGIPVSYISTGPHTEQLIVRE